MELTNAQQERVYDACIGLLERTGAKAAVLCDAATGSVLATFGDASAQGEASEVERVSERETVVRGGPGELYGVDLAGGLLLAVLHDGTRLDAIRAEADGISLAIAEILAAEPASERKKDAAPRKEQAASRKKQAAPRKKQAAPRKKPARKPGRSSTRRR